MGCGASGAGFGLLGNHRCNQMESEKNKQNLKGLVDELQSLKTVSPASSLEVNLGSENFSATMQRDKQETKHLCAEMPTAIDNVDPESTQEGQGLHQGVNNQSQQPQPKQVPIVKEGFPLDLQSPNDSRWCSKHSAPNGHQCSSSIVIERLGGAQSLLEVRPPQSQLTPKQSQGDAVETATNVGGAQEIQLGYEEPWALSDTDLHTGSILATLDAVIDEGSQGLPETRDLSELIGDVNPFEITKQAQGKQVDTTSLGYWSSSKKTSQIKSSVQPHNPLTDGSEEGSSLVKRGPSSP